MAGSVLLGRFCAPRGMEMIIRFKIRVHLRIPEKVIAWFSDPEID
jgi:hypothetical protein